MPAPIHIAAAADDNYIPHLGAMLHSLFTHNTQPIVFHFLHRQNINQQLLEQLVQVAEPFQQTIQCHSADPQLFQRYPVGTAYSEETWYRLHFSDFLAELPERMLWIDADTIVRRSIQPLWDMPLGQHPFAAVTNPFSIENWPYLDELGIADRGQYFNAGIMVMDMSRFLAATSPAAILEKIEQFEGRTIRYVDQDILNMIFAGQQKVIHPHWNFQACALHNRRETARVQGRKAAAEARKDPAIIHYTGSDMKPWLYKSPHPWRQLYLQHRHAAGFGVPAYNDRTWLTVAARPIPYSVRALVSYVRRGHWHLVRQMVSY